MILFLYGKDSYRSKQKLDAIKSKYIDASLGDTNLSIADFADKNLDFTQITRMILAFPFLAKNRLVILKNLLSEGNKKLQEQFLGLLEKVPSSTVLIIYESETPDRRTSLFKKLNKPKQSQEFKPLEPSQLKKWIADEVEKQGGKIESQAIEKLIEYVGSDLWRMSNEIQKVATYKYNARSSSKGVRSIGASLPYIRNVPSNGASDPLLTSELAYINSSDVELLVKPKVEANIFEMIDFIGQKNSEQAIKSLHDLLGKGENELYILTMIVYQFRNLLIIKDILENSKSQETRYKQTSINNFQIAKISGLNPYVVQKTMSQAKNYSMNSLRTIYSKLLDYDLKIKTGKIGPKTALDILVIELSS